MTNCEPILPAKFWLRLSAMYLLAAFRTALRIRRL
jgi:hypothetical protein